MAGSMMTRELKIGDVVRLHSGGPRLTIVGFSHGSLNISSNIRVGWFVQGVFYSAEVGSDAVNVVEALDATAPTLGAADRNGVRREGPSLGRCSLDASFRQDANLRVGEGSVLKCDPRARAEYKACPRCGGGERAVPCDDVALKDA
jgi:uncharacterized protein YodC (DUF2158 family)